MGKWTENKLGKVLSLAIGSAIGVSASHGWMPKEAAMDPDIANGVMFGGAVTMACLALYSSLKAVTYGARDHNKPDTKIELKLAVASAVLTGLANVAKNYPEPEGSETSGVTHNTPELVQAF